MGELDWTGQGALQRGAGRAGVGGDGDHWGVRRGQAALQFVGEHEVGQLGLGVRAAPAVVVLGLQVAEVDPAQLVPVAAHGDHPRSRRGQQSGQDQAGQGEGPEMVGPELQLEAVAGPVVGGHHDPGVVDEQIDPGVAVGDLAGRRADGRQRGQVQGHALGAGAGLGGGDLAGGDPGLVQVPAGQHDPGAVPGQLTGNLVAEAGVGPGDDGDAAGLITDVGRRPRREPPAQPSDLLPGVLLTGARLARALLSRVGLAHAEPPDRSGPAAPAGGRRGPGLIPRRGAYHKL